MDAPAISLAAGDPRRRSLRRAVVGACLVGVLFSAFAFAVKEVHAVGDHVPWQDDPFDAVVSFAIFFAPLALVVTLVRLPLCREAEPLPTRRALDVLNGATLIVGIAIVTIASDWVALVLGAERASWTSLTPFIVAVLTALTALIALAAGSVVRVRHALAGEPAGGGVDLLGDLAILARSWTPRGAGQVRMLAVLTATERRLVPVIRRHAVLLAGVLALAFGLMLGTVEARGEGSPAPVVGLFVTVGGAGMFAFLVLAGAYLGWVRPETALAPGLRRLLDASVAAAVSVPLALGFRDELTRVANTSPVRDVDRLAALLAIVAATAFVAVLVGESLLRRSRADAPEKSGAGGRTDSESRSP